MDKGKGYWNGKLSFDALPDGSVEEQVIYINC